MTTAPEESMAYVGYCASCGSMVSAVVDDPERAKDVRKTVNDFMRNGRTIGRVSCQTVRDSLKPCEASCTCKFCLKKRRGTSASEKSDSPLHRAGGE